MRTDAEAGWINIATGDVCKSIILTSCAPFVRTNPRAEGETDEFTMLSRTGTTQDIDDTSFPPEATVVDVGSLKDDTVPTLSSAAAST